MLVADTIEHLHRYLAFLFFMDMFKFNIEWIC